MFFVSLLALTLAVLPSNGLYDGLSNPVHRTWSVPQGLPQSSVHALAQGPGGWIYVGTQEGIARFDGNTWQTLWLGSAGAPCRPVDALARGPRQVWVGTQRCGLFRIDGGVAHPVGGLDSKHVVALHADPDGTLWVATDRSISRRSPQGRTEVLLRGAVRAFQVTANGFWAAADGHLRFIPSRGAPRDVPELHGQVISALALAGDNLWVGTVKGGLFEVRDFHARRQEGPTAVSALLVDRQGTLWVGDRDGGLSRSGPRGLEPVRGFEGVPPLALLEDREGSIWVGTSSHGVHQLRPAQIRNVGVAEGLSSPVSWAIAQDAQGTIWIGTENGRLVHLEHGRPVVEELPNRLAGASVFDLSIAPDGALWMGTRKGYAVKRGAIITPLGPDSGLPAIAGTILARRDGSIWAGNAQGLFRSSGGRFERVAAVPPGLRVFGLRETSDGALWAGTNGGVFVLRGRAVRRYTEKDGLGGDRIFEISEDADRPGAVWVGGSDGISLIDHGVVHTVRGAQGLTRELDISIVDDGHGRLWVGTDRGIFMVEKAQLAALFAGKRRKVDRVSFGVADGMRNPECNGYSNTSSMRARDGELWFATMGGAVHFHPDQLKPSIPQTRVTLVSATSNGAPLAEGGRIEPADPNLEIQYVAPTFLDPLRLRYRYRLDGFDEGWIDAGRRRYALYTNLPPGHYTFRVQAYVPGQWSSAEARLAFWRPPRLSERPAFYPVVGLLLLLLLGMGVFAHVRRLERRVRERTSELRAALDRIAQSERSVRISERMASIGTLAAGVAHEINNPLAYVCANVDFALEELRDATTPLYADRIGEIVSALMEASDGAQRVKRIVKDLKTFSRAEDGPPSSIDVRRVFETALNLSRSTVSQRARLQVDLRAVPSVRGVEGQLAQVLVNLLVNASQAISPGAAEREEITARCALAGDGWILAEVRDTGSGITPETLRHIFDPFFTTKPVGVGTGLGLSICHGIVSGMGGRIEVESVVGQGSTFRVRLPPELGPEVMTQGRPPSRVEHEA